MPSGLMVWSPAGSSRRTPLQGAGVAASTACAGAAMAPAMIAASERVIRADLMSAPTPAAWEACACALNGVAQPLRLGEAFELLQRVILDLADAVARDV